MTSWGFGPKQPFCRSPAAGARLAFVCIRERNRASECTGIRRPPISATMGIPESTIIFSLHALFFSILSVHEVQGFRDFVNRQSPAIKIGGGLTTNTKLRWCRLGFDWPPGPSSNLMMETLFFFHVAPGAAATSLEELTSRVCELLPYQNDPTLWFDRFGETAAHHHLSASGTATCRGTRRKSASGGTRRRGGRRGQEGGGLYSPDQPGSCRSGQWTSSTPGARSARLCWTEAREGDAGVGRGEAGVGRGEAGGTRAAASARGVVEKTQANGHGAQKRLPRTRTPPRIKGQLSYPGACPPRGHPGCVESEGAWQGSQGCFQLRLGLNATLTAGGFWRSNVWLAYGGPEVLDKGCERTRQDFRRSVLVRLVQCVITGLLFAADV